MRKHIPNQTRQGRGRPTEYRPEFCNSILESDEVAREGATDAAIAKALGVSRESVIRWRGEHAGFAAACSAVKQIADDAVEASLFNRGRGYSHDAVKVFMPAGAAAPVYAPYVEHYPPDTQAASLWLRNRRPKEWRDRIEHTGNGGGPIEVRKLDPDLAEVLKALSTEERRALRPLLAAAAKSAVKPTPEEAEASAE